MCIGCHKGYKVHNLFETQQQLYCSKIVTVMCTCRIQTHNLEQSIAPALGTDKSVMRKLFDVSNRKPLLSQAEQFQEWRKAESFQ